VTHRGCACLMGCLLDFFYQTPGCGIGKRCAETFFHRLEAFGIFQRLLATVNDNGSDALYAARELSRLLEI
jgi:hypothetical protein